MVTPFSEEEIKRSVDALPGDKSPRPDGFPLCFFKHFWQTLKPDILEMFDKFFQTSDINTLKCINQTFLTLIPKKSHVERVQDFRPISLLNSSYKIISKCLANRLSPILNELLDESQSAVLPGGSISDCFLVAQETLHFMNASHSPGLLLKLDFEKAFNNVN